MKVLKTLILTVIGILLIGFGLIQIYENHNDGEYVNGRGILLVKNCDKNGNDYRCSGDFRQNGGMVSLAAATVNINKMYKPGQYIYDLFPTYNKYKEIDGKRVDVPIAGTLTSGTELRSLRHNLPYIAMSIIGAGVLLGQLIVAMTGKKRALHEI